MAADPRTGTSHAGQGESYRAIARDYAPLTFQAIGCIVRRHKPKKP